MKLKLSTAKGSILVILLFMLTLCLTLGLCIGVKADKLNGATAYAEGETEPNYVAIYHLGASGDNSGNEYYYDFATGWNNANNNSSVNSVVKVILEADWTATANDNYITSFGNDGYGIEYGELLVKENAYIVLDLNGHKIDRNAKDGAPTEITEKHQGSAIKVSGTLEIINGAVTEATITGGYGTAVNTAEEGEEANYELRGGAIYVDGGELTLSKNINITGNTAARGAGIAVSSGTLTVNGSVFNANTAKIGGGVYVGADGTATINDGTFSENKATNYGGGISSDGTLIINRATISDNTATICGAVSIFGGNATITDCTILSNLSESTHSSFGGGGVYIVAGAVTINGGEISGNESKSNAGGIYVNGGANIDINVEINNCKISGNKATNGGGIRSAGAVTINGGEISGNTASSNGGAIYVGGDNINITDCKLLNNTATTSGNGIYTSGGTVTISGSEIASDSATPSGGAIYATKSTVYIENSTEIKNNTATSYGGGIYINGSTVTITDSTISGNSTTGTASKTGGGGIYSVGSSAVTIDNTIISNNTSNVLGGGIYANGGSVEVNNSTISSNTATTDGGGIYATVSTVTIDNVTISSNTANNGGGMYLSGSTVKVNNSTIGGISENEEVILGNIATTNAGGIFIGSNSDVTVTGSEISSSTAGNYGGGFYVSSGKLTVSGGKILNNATSANGGAICIGGTSSVVTISNNCEVSGNTAGSGGAVYLDNGVITVTDSEISGNTSNTRGGGIYAFNNGEINIENAIFENNSSSTGGGAVYSYKASLNVSGSTFKDNKVSGAYNGGAIYVQIDTTIEITTKISDCVITGNEANTGAGLFFSSTQPQTVELSDLVLENNKARQWGGALYLGGTNVTYKVSNCTLQNNTATVYGGGLYVAGSCTTTVTDCEITNNSAGNGGGIAVFGGNVTLNGNTKVEYNYAGDSRLDATVYCTGGGIFVYTGTLNFSDKVVVNNNYYKCGYDENGEVLTGEAATNKTINNIKFVSIINIDRLTDGAYVSIFNLTEADNGKVLTQKYGANSLKYLHADRVADEDCTFILNADNQVVFYTENVEQKAVEWTISGAVFDGDTLEFEYGDIYYVNGDNKMVIALNGTEVKLEGFDNSPLYLPVGEYYALGQTEDGTTVRFNVIVSKLKLTERTDENPDGNLIINWQDEGIDENGEVVFTGSAINPNVAITIVYGTGESVSPDYDAVYENNINVGTATVSVTVYGSDNYEGLEDILRQFTIVKPETPLTITWQHKDGEGNWVNGTELTFNNEERSEDIRAVLSYGSYEIIVDKNGVSTDTEEFSLVFESEINEAKDYTVKVTGSSINCDMPEETSCTVTVIPFSIGRITANSFNSADSNSRQPWLLHVDESTSELLSNVTYTVSDGENTVAVEGNKAYYYARFRDKDISIELNPLFTVNGYSIDYLVSIGASIDYKETNVAKGEANKLTVVTTEVYIDFGGNIANEAITITKEWAIVSINNGLIDSLGNEYSVVSSVVYGEDVFEEAPIPEHGTQLEFVLKSGETELDSFEMTYIDGVHTLFIGGEEQDIDFAEYLNTAIIENYGARTYRLSVTIKGCVENGIEYFEVTRTFQFTVERKPITEADVKLTVSEIVYSGRALEPIVTPLNGVSIVTQYYNNINAGIATVNVTGFGNYTGAVILNFTIKPATDNAWVGTFIIPSWTYGEYDSSKAFVSEAKYGTPVITVVDSEGNFVNDLANAPAGSYRVMAVVYGTDNYNGVSQRTGTFTISKAANSWAVLPNVVEWKYDGFDKNINLVLGTGNFGVTSYVIYNANGRAITDSFTTVNGVVPQTVADILGDLHSGSYTLEATVAETTNYRALSDTVGFKVDKAANGWKTSPAVIAWEFGNYDAAVNLFLAEPAFGSVAFAVTDINGNTINDSLNNIKLTLKDGVYVVTSQVVIGLLNGLEAGSYMLTVTVTVDSDHDEIAASNVVFKVAAASNVWVVAPNIISWQFGDFNRNVNIIEASVSNGDIYVTVTDVNGKVLVEEFMLGEDRMFPESATDTLNSLVKGEYKIAVRVVTEDSNFGAVSALQPVSFTVSALNNNWLTTPGVVTWQFNGFVASTNILLGAAKQGEIIYCVTDKDGVILSRTTVHADGTFTLDENGLIPVDLHETLNGLKAGSYILVARVAGTENYSDLRTETAFTVAQADNMWTTSPSIEAWTVGQFDKAVNVISAEAKFGKIDFVICEVENESNVIYDSAKGINKLDEAGVGVYILRASVEGTADYRGISEFAFTFSVFDKPGMPWWVILIIVVGVLGVVAVVLWVLHEKGVLQLLTSKVVVAMRTKMSVDATIAAVRASMVAENSKRTRAEAEERERREALLNASPEEQAAILEQKAKEAAELVEKMQGKMAKAQDTAKEIKENNVSVADKNEPKGE